jgi:hypothetical protein
MTDQQLINFSGEHLMHELSMLWETACALPEAKEGTTVYIALLESFAIHLRNLIEFFFFPTRGEYVRARHFFDDPASWPDKATAEWTKLYSRASNEVSHLTTGRVDGNPAEKVWFTQEALKRIEPVAQEFAAKASDRKLHAKVREFLGVGSAAKLVWISGNVTHSNVASQALTFSSGGASTATQIILKVDPHQP